MLSRDAGARFWKRSRSACRATNRAEGTIHTHTVKGAENRNVRSPVKGEARSMSEGVPMPQTPVQCFNPEQTNAVACAAMAGDTVFHPFRTENGEE